jgi:dUTP pyrophosphatase
MAQCESPIYESKGPLLKLRRENPRIPLPSYESEGAAGLDLCAFLDQDLILKPMGRAMISTGLTIEIPDGYEAQVRPRSGLAIKYGLTVLNSPGTIDSDYRGVVQVIMVNLGDQDVAIKDGQRIAQLVITPVLKARLEETQILSYSNRGCAGFGSTG